MAVPFHLLYALELTPKALTKIVYKVDPARVDTAPSEGRFTLRESVSHVLDWEPIFRSRFEQAVERPGSPIEMYSDEDNWPIERRYSEWDIHDSLRRLSDERQKTLEFLKALTADESERTAVHPRLGVMAVPDIGWLLLMHDVYHLEHATLLL